MCKLAVATGDLGYPCARAGRGDGPTVFRAGLLGGRGAPTAPPAAPGHVTPRGHGAERVTPARPAPAAPRALPSARSRGRPRGLATRVGCLFAPRAPGVGVGMGMPLDGAPGRCIGLYSDLKGKRVLITGEAPRLRGLLLFATSS